MTDYNETLYAYGARTKPMKASSLIQHRQQGTEADGTD